MDEVGFKVGDDFYPLVTEFGQLDLRLMLEISGLPLQELVAALDQPETVSDEVAMAGNGALFAVAFWEQHRDWKIEKVYEYVAKLKVQPEWVGSEEDEQEAAEGDAGPPALSDGHKESEKSSSTSSSGSNGSQGSTSLADSTLAVSGLPRSVTGFPV